MSDIKIRVELRLNKPSFKMIEELKEENGLSRNKMIEECIKLYYTQGTVDEHILLARIMQLEKKIDWLNNKTELFYKLINFILPFFIAHLPDLPTDKKEGQIVLDKGSRKMLNLVMAFRKSEQANDISFAQQIWGDTQETLKENYETK